MTSSGIGGNTPQTIGTALAVKVMESSFLASVIEELERASRERFIYGPTSVISKASDETVLAALRFADLLSHSQDYMHRSVAYKIVAIMHDLSSWDLIEPGHRDALVGVTESVLIELGNFPAIRTLRRSTNKELAAPLSKEATRALKSFTNETKRGGDVYTDAQVAVVESLDSASFFSFSGPTSLGKSFILKDRIFGLVSKPEMKDRAIVVLVPTRALISQTIKDLQESLADIDSVHISQHPRLSPYVRRRFSTTIFVFTPERLLNYFGNASRRIEYLFVDEAQKVIAEGDSRSPLYYHAINETLRKFATKLAFASPNISNPEIFLQLFQKSAEAAVSVPERTVTQQRYFVDLVDSKVDHYRDILQKDAVRMNLPSGWTTKFDVVRALTGNAQSIVYINSARTVVTDAMLFANDLPRIDDKRLHELITFATEHVHEDYFLIECLKKGVAFHHGRMPQELRERIERLYGAQNSPLQYVFCTSTLLEGVNMPAKNIFILSDQHGLRDLTQMDFENLIGRAGRLTYDFSGNVICVRHSANAWSGKTRSLIEASQPLEATSFLVNPAPRRVKEFTDIGKILTAQPLPKDRSADAKRTSRQYASILTLHQIDGQSSSLKTLFLDRVEKGKEKLQKVASDVTLPTGVLRKTPDIDPKYQEAVWRSCCYSSDSFRPLIPEGADTLVNQPYLEALRRLYDLYGWSTEESVGTYKLVPKVKQSLEPTEARLRYWANLMRNWVAGKPLNLIIRSSINYFREEGVITVRDFSTESTYKTVPFDDSDTGLINQVIENTLLDIEVGLRYRIMRYLQNFQDLAIGAVGKNAAGVDLASLVEYGTQDPVAVALQDAGLSRSSAIVVSTQFPSSVEVSDVGDLVDIQVKNIILGLKGDRALAKELIEVFRLDGYPLGVVPDATINGAK